MSQRARSLVAPALATVVGIAVLVSLGVWQLQRLAWKEALIAAVESRVHAAPEDLPAEADWPRLNPADYEYRHVRLAGVYDASRQALVFRALGSPRGRYGGPGYLVMTPLRLANGAVVLVNRGFVPQDRKDQAASRGLGAGETLVTGLMRASEERTWFTPADNPVGGQWFTRDVEAIARAMGLQSLRAVLDRRRRGRRSGRSAGRRRNDRRLPEQPFVLCDDLVRDGAGAGGRLYRLRRHAASRRREKRGTTRAGRRRRWWALEGLNL